MPIKIEHLYHIYDEGLPSQQVALQDINFIFEDHCFTALIGQTGSGKSTLIQHLNGLLIPTSGKIDINSYLIDISLVYKEKKGQKIIDQKAMKKKRKAKLKDIKTLRKKVGIVFQFPEYQLFEETILKDIIFGPKNFGIKEEEAKTKALQAAKLLGISDELLTKSPFNLSGGQMRKVAIAGILAYNPDILLLDEPTRGLDPKTASEVMAIFNKINKEYHKTIIVITHDMNLVYKYANRVIGMKDGQIHFDGKPLDLFSSNIYKECHLAKPDILALVDYLNLKMDLNLGYDIYSEEELLKRLKDVTK